MLRGNRRVAHPPNARLYVAAVVAAIVALTAAPSALAGLHKEFSIFSDCPVTAPKAATCVVSTTTSGDFVWHQERARSARPSCSGVRSTTARTRAPERLR